MKNVSKTFAINNQEIQVAISLDEVIDYNEEHGFDVDDECYTKSWVAANVVVEINDEIVYGQVQYDNLNKCYSLDCDGNNFGSDVKNAVLNCFDEESLYTTVETDTYVDKIESDLHCDIVNVLAPQISEMICDFGKESIKNK